MIQYIYAFKSNQRKRLGGALRPPPGLIGLTRLLKIWSVSVLTRLLRIWSVPVLTRLLRIWSVSVLTRLLRIGSVSVLIKLPGIRSASVNQATKDTVSIGKPDYQGYGQYQ